VALIDRGWRPDSACWRLPAHALAALRYPQQGGGRSRAAVCTATRSWRYLACVRSRASERVVEKNTPLAACPHRTAQLNRTCGRPPDVSSRVAPGECSWYGRRSGSPPWSAAGPADRPTDGMFIFRLSAASATATGAVELANWSLRRRLDCPLFSITSPALTAGVSTTWVRAGDPRPARAQRHGRAPGDDRLWADRVRGPVSPTRLSVRYAARVVWPWRWSF